MKQTWLVWCQWAGLQRGRNARLLVDFMIQSGPAWCVFSGQVLCQPILQGELREIEILPTSWVNVCFEKHCVLFFSPLSSLPHPLLWKQIPYTHPFLPLHLILAFQSRPMLLVFLSWISYGGLLFVRLYKSTLVPVFLVTLATTLERRQAKTVHASREQGAATLPDSTGEFHFSFPQANALRLILLLHFHLAKSQSSWLDEYF